MAQPPAYNRDTDFARNAGSNTDHNALNAEFDRASNSINDIRHNLALLQADDGRLRKDTVTHDSLDSELIRYLSADVLAGVQDELDRASAAALKAESAIEGIDEKIIQTDTAARLAAEKAEEAVRTVQQAQEAAQALERASLQQCEAEGSPDAMQVRINGLLPLEDMQAFFIRVPGENITAAPVIHFVDDADAPVSCTVVKGMDVPLDAGDMAGDHLFQYNARLEKIVLLNPTSIRGTQAEGLPVGAVTMWMGTNTPKDFLSLDGKMISREDYPALFDTVWCGEPYNADADFFYRTVDDAGTMRSSTGDYMKMPEGSRYFVRGRDETGTGHPYQYQGDTLQNHTHRRVPQPLAVSRELDTANSGTVNFAAGGYAYAEGTDTGLVANGNAGDETRPMNFPVKWIIRARCSAVYENGVDVIALKARVEGLEAVVEGVSNGTGVPVGSIIEWGGRPDSIPPGYMNIKTDTVQVVQVDTYPAFANAVGCGEENNEDADFFYRCNSANGWGRNVAGQYIVLPMAARYFTRGRAAAGESHPYQYQQDAFQGHRHESGMAIGIVSQESTARAYMDSKMPGKFNYPPIRDPISDGEHGEPRTADETRPMNFPVLYLIKLYEAIYNPAMLDIGKLVEAANENAVPLGMVAGFWTNQAPPGWLEISRELPSFHRVETLPQFVPLYYCGDEYNDTAHFAFRCDNPDGTGRNPEGAWICIGAAGKRFMRGRDETGVINPYQHQEGAIASHTSTVSGIAFTGTSTATSLGALNNTAANGLVAYTGTAAGDLVEVTDIPKLKAPYVKYEGEAETRPENFPVMWCIKVASAVVSRGLVDVTGLLNQYSDLNSRLSVSTIIYPNGGTAEEAGSVSINQRIVMDNPYPGYYVQCEAQLFLDGQWGAAGFMYAGGGYGVDAWQFGERNEQVVIQTGGTYLTSSSSNIGSPFGRGDAVTVAPCRVIVTRGGKIQ
ncbi:MAG: hypothetical protein GX776_01080 [Oxalobacter sp.]|nr:hypothetical protein [Oxalobacter sp.]